MNLEALRDHCIGMPGFSEDLPFNENTLAFRVGGKIFALMDIENFEGVNLKCDPGRAFELRERYAGITPGYHMNKRHWNTVATDDDIPNKLFLELVDHSYALVSASLTAKVRRALMAGA